MEKEKVVYRVIVQKTVTRPVAKTIVVPTTVEGSSAPVPQIEMKTETLSVFSQDVEGELDVAAVICAVNGLKKPEPEKVSK